MKKTLNFETEMERRNILKDIFMALFLMFASYPRLLLEVFVRKNMGERYFSMASVLTIFVILAAVPFIIVQTTSPYVIAQNKLWYLFLALFLFAANKRRLEIKRLPSVFDFGRYSKTKGVTNPLLYKFSIFKNLGIRNMRKFGEPSIFFVAGLLLLLIQQWLLGGLLIVSSILFSLSFAATFYYGDHKIMDIIDDIMKTEDMVKSFLDDDDDSISPRGVEFFGRKPGSKEMRQKVLSYTRRKEDVAEAI